LRLWIKALVLTLVFAAPASAGQLTSRSLPRGCDRDTDQVIAFACDPARQAGAPVLTLGTISSRRLDGAEALQPGETVTLAWRHPSPRAMLYLNVASPTVGTHGVNVNLRQGAERVVVTVGDGGSLTVTPGGVVPPAELPHVAWAPRTPRAAARLVLNAVRHMQRSLGALQTLCASLPGGVRDYYTFGFPLDDRACLQIMALSILGDENVPNPVSTHAAGLSVKVNGTHAVMRTRLFHRYLPESTGDPRHLAVNARALLVRDAGGVWRLATPETLFPLTAVGHRRAFPDSELRKVYSFTARQGRKWTAHNLRVQRQATARAAPSPCTVATITDPLGDVLAETVEPARDQVAHSGGDAVSGGFDGRCLTLRTAGPLPAAFTVTSGSGVTMEVANGTVKVFTGDVDDEDTPIRGAVADLGARTLTVLLPRRVTVDDVDVHVDFNDVDYGDTLIFH
jgi:hypothetical protein